MLQRNKYTKEEAVRLMINKSLEKYKIDYDYIIENQSNIREQTGKEWFQIYTFDTPEEFEEWKKFCIDLMTKRLKPYNIGKERAEREFDWINLNFGLSQPYLDESRIQENSIG